MGEPGNRGWLPSNSTSICISRHASCRVFPGATICLQCRDGKSAGRIADRRPGESASGPLVAAVAVRKMEISGAFRWAAGRGGASFPSTDVVGPRCFDPAPQRLTL